jgi:endonuclease/exonuclease/phosphatase family metal-dependent hydrolase
MKRLFRLFALLPLGLALASANADELKVMTQNQYFGADFGALVTATTPEEFNTAVVEAMQTIAANLPAERMSRIAAVIAKEKADVVGLQEVFQFGCINLVPPATGQGCDHPSIAGAFTDNLQITLDALDGAYVVAGRVINLDVPGLPFMIDGYPGLVSTRDNDVILVRTDLAATPVDFSAVCAYPSADGCNYRAFAEIVTAYGSVAWRRGYVGVDLSFDGRDYRIVNTHLDPRFPLPGNPLSRFLQTAQAAELVQVLHYTTPPGVTLLAVGDFNSDDTDTVVPGPLPLPPPFNAGLVPPYMQFVAAGFTDAWTLRPGKAEAFTCCQLDDLSNHQSVLYERVDLVFTREMPVEVKKARVVGDSVSDKTMPKGLGLWPADHGGVSMTIRW